MTISFEDGLKILSMARESVSKPPAQPDPPATRESTLSEDQAHAFQLMMLVTGQNGQTVGKGQSTQHNMDGDSYGIDRQVGGPEGPGDAQAQLAQRNPDPGPGASP